MLIAYSIGTLLLVTQRMERWAMGDGRRTWVPVPLHTDPVLVAVTGHVIRYDGIRVGGGRQLWDDYEPPHFERERSHRLLEVRTWVGAKPWLVRLEDVSLAPEGAVLPTSQPGPVWDKRAKQEMRTIMKDWPRDARGRWMKERQG